MTVQHQSFYRKVTDPRTNLWVAKGLWPDCPDCQGLLAANDGPWGPPLFNNDETPEPEEIPFPCPTCQVKNQHLGTVQPKHYWEKGPITPYGTWPDCPECHGRGQHRYESSWDGHRSDYSYRPCQSCSQRTAMHHSSQPTELDRLLEQQQSELTPLTNQQRHLMAQLNMVYQELEKMKHRHDQEAQPHLEELKNRQAATTSSS